MLELWRTKQVLPYSDERGMRLLAVFYNEMEKNKDKISFIKSYQEIEKIFYKNVLRLYKDIL